MTTYVEPGSGTIRHREKKMFVGKVNEQTVRVGQTVVKSDARFVSSERTPFGPQDAERERALSRGLKAPVPFYQRVAASAKRVADALRKKAELRKIADEGGDADARNVHVTVAPQTGPAAILAARLEAFADDPEMQQVVFAKWQKEQNALRVAAHTAPPVDNDHVAPGAEQFTSAPPAKKATK